MSKKYVVVCTLFLLFLACKKKSNVIEENKTFNASWVENDTSKIYTAKSAYFNIKQKVLTLFVTPTANSARNLNIYLKDTLVNNYAVSTIGSGYTAATINATNCPDGIYFFNAATGTFTISDKQPDYISGTFELVGNSNGGTGYLNKIKGSFNYVSITR